MDLSKLTTEAPNPATAEIDRLSGFEIVALMNAEDAQVAPAVARVAPQIAAAIEAIAARLRRGGRLIYLGAGTSGRLGVLDASECPPTFNSPPWQVVGLIAGGPTALTRAVEGAEDRPQLAAEDLQRINLGRDDAVVGIATSGRTPYVLGGLRYAGEVGALTIGLTCNEDSDLAAVSQFVIVPVVGPEVISGSTRLKAGTATKMVLNMLSTGVMVQLGKTYGNLMVDLQTTNRKLTDRSQRIVRQLTGVTADEAVALLERCGGDTKTAIVVYRRSASPQDAKRLLQAAQGQLRAALEVVDDSVASRPPPAPVEAANPPDAASRPSRLVLGVDGGGTKTVAWLATADQGEIQVLGRGEAGSSNPHASGWPAALDNLQCAVDRALLAAGAARGDVHSACLALAGAGRESERQRIEQWARQKSLAEHILVTHDAMPVLAAGTPDSVGVGLISGTGSLAFGRNAAGQSARAGGWGYLLGDEGSGYVMARQGLQAAARAWDGRGPQTLLTDRLLAALDVKAANEIVQAVYGRAADRDWIAGLAKIVVAAAEAGDDVALRIVDEAATELALLFRATASQLGFLPQPDPLYLALAGGTLVHAPLLRNRLLDKIRADGCSSVQVQVVAEPVLGAVRLAVATIH